MLLLAYILIGCLALGVIAALVALYKLRHVHEVLKNHRDAVMQLDQTVRALIQNAVLVSGLSKENSERLDAIADAVFSDMDETLVN